MPVDEKSPSLPEPTGLPVQSWLAYTVTVVPESESPPTTGLDELLGDGVIERFDGAAGGSPMALAEFTANA